MYAVCRCDVRICCEHDQFSIRAANECGEPCWWICDHHSSRILLYRWILIRRPDGSSLHNMPRGWQLVTHRNHLSLLLYILYSLLFLFLFILFVFNYFSLFLFRAIKIVKIIIREILTSKILILKTLISKIFQVFKNINTKNINIKNISGIQSNLNNN